MSLLTKIQYDYQCDECGIILLGQYQDKGYLDKKAGEHEWKTDLMDNHYCSDLRTKTNRKIRNR